jgi:hypothetical protein
MKPLCFVLMPFGQKTDAAGLLINFDAVYEQLIKPAILSRTAECFAHVFEPAVL